MAFTFLYLPPESRNLIYDKYFQDACITIDLNHPLTRGGTPAGEKRRRIVRDGQLRIIDHSPHAMLLTCRQIYTEVLLLLEPRVIAKLRLTGAVHTLPTTGANAQNLQLSLIAFQLAHTRFTFGYGLGGPVFNGRGIRKLALPISLLRYPKHITWFSNWDIWFPHFELLIVYETAESGMDIDAVRLDWDNRDYDKPEVERWAHAVYQVLHKPAYKIGPPEHNALNYLGRMPRDWTFMIEQHVSPRRIMQATIGYTPVSYVHPEEFRIEVEIMDHRNKLVPQQEYRDGFH